MRISATSSDTPPSAAPVGLATSGPSQACLSVERLAAGYAAVEVLRGVSVSLQHGHIGAVLGPNGAGKTTLLRAIAGHQARVFSGELRFNGRSLVGRPAWRRAHDGICYIPEGRAIFRDLTVRENLRMYGGGRLHPEQLDRVVDAFPALADRQRQRAGSLSGGQQQMLALARAVVTQPELLLIDEMSLGLAPGLVEELFGFLRQLRAEGRTVVLVEQYVKQAIDVADAVYTLNKGQVVFAGTPGEVTDLEAFMELYIEGA